MAPSSTLTTQQLTAYVKLAGFDYVHFSSPNSIEVCVRIQDGLEAQVVPFPQSNFLAVPLPLDEEEEYGYPTEHANETRKPLLFDKTSNPNELSDYFKLYMFLSPGVRYVRLDPIFLNLLDIAYTHFEPGFYIIPGSAYRPRSVNRNNMRARHVKETYRFQMGQAVEIMPNNHVNEDTLFQLGISLMKAGRSIRTLSIGIGIGAKKDRLYFHIRPLKRNQHFIDVWDSGSHSLYMKFKEVQDQISKGM